MGLYGSWGSGKSTILDLVARRLGNGDRLVVVRVSPWEYDKNTDVKATLIAEVLSAVHTASSQAKTTFKDDFVKLAKRVRWSKALALAANSITLSLPKPSDLLEIFGKDDEPNTLEPTLAGFRKQFADLMEKLSDVDRVVVIVDDLDRCLPESVIETLEGIKLFLAVPKMGFLVATDEAPVIEAVRCRYEKSVNSESMARQYLEKIIQIPIRVPLLSRADTVAYIAVLLLEHAFSPEDVTAVVSHCDFRRRDAEDDLLLFLADELAGPGDSSITLARSIAPTLWKALNGNPRRIKRFLNAFWLRSAIGQERSVILDAPILAKLMVLEELWPTEFRTLLSWSVDGLVSEQLKRLEKSEASSDDLAEVSPILRAWAVLAPPIADVPLGAYLSLAASLVNVSQGGSRLRPEVEALANRLASESETDRKAVHDEVSASSIEDRCDLASELLHRLVAFPDRQGDLSDSLAFLASTDARVVETIDVVMRDFDVSRIEPAMIGWFSSQASLQPLVRRWHESGKLTASSKTAATKSLKITSS